MTLNELYEECRQNNIIRIKELLVDYSPDINILNEMITKKQTKVINLLLSKINIYNLQTLNATVVSNNETLFFRISQNVVPDHSTLYETISIGNIVFLDYLLSKQIYPSIDDVIMSLMTNSNDIIFFKKLSEYCVYPEDCSILISKATYDLINKDKLLYLEEQKIKVIIDENKNKNKNKNKSNTYELI